MTWTYEEIEQDWLGGSRIAVAPDEVLAAFVRCDRMLGRGWIDSAKQNSKGSAPTLAVVAVGQQLAFLEDIAEPQRLIGKLRDRDQSAFAELRAIYLLRSREPTRVELEPTVSVSGRERKCDFRIQRPSEPWIYVEVTQPDISDAQARVQALLGSIADVVQTVKKQFALEVFFRREPSDDEVAPLKVSILEFCSMERAESAAPVQQEMPNGMGVLFLNHQQVGQVVIDDHGEQPVPRLGAARAVVGAGEPNRHIAVRVPYSDERAEQFLTSEARQLPTDSPGLIMIEMGRAPGGFRTWEPLLQRRFQPAIHTRVGGVYLFTSGLNPTPLGEAVLFETKLITNTHARMPLPAWIATACAAVHEESETRMRIV